MKTETIEKITHHATVESVAPGKGTITVKLHHSDDCGSCPALQLCEASKSKTLTLPVARPQRFKAGEKVELSGTERIHRKALMMATVYPCIALVAAMTGIYIACGNQLTAVAGGLGVMIFFFAMLYAFRNKMRHEFSFEVNNEVHSTISAENPRKNDSEDFQ